MESIKQELQKLVKKHREKEGRRVLYLTKFLRKVAKNGNGIKSISIKAFRDMATDLNETDLKFLKDNGFDVNKAEISWSINEKNWESKMNFYDVVALNKLSDLSYEYHKVTDQLEKEMIKQASKGEETVFMEYKVKLPDDKWIGDFTCSVLFEWLTKDPRFEGLSFIVDNPYGENRTRTYTIKTNWKEDRMK